MSVTAIRRAIYGKLAGDVTLNNLLGTPASGYTHSIYHNQAPDNAGFPFIVFNRVSSVPIHALADPAAFENEIWLIKAVDRSASSDVAESISDRIQVLLNDAGLSISGAKLAYLRRQTDVDYPEESEGVTFRHVGSNYRLNTVAP